METSSYVYLGRSMNMENNLKDELDRRRRAAWAAFGPLREATDQLADPDLRAHLFDSTFTGWELADPICTFFFSVIVLFTTIHVLRDIFFVLMEVKYPTKNLLNVVFLATPRHMDFNAVKEDLSALENVQSVHDLHMWSLNMDKTALSVHLAIDSSEHALSTVTAARQLIHQKYGISKATVQVESYDKSMNSCEMCLT
ncbi:hypothetical protein ANCCEY_12738 [Ancylostoma ceylanicum]|uniref:Cation efflux protein cytoplasmic domain-containing protein n=1 Tax=Ancylostoma ceylanicum TaxID=53326 RepID=A0A0D6LKM4_9BILA|nr:hypothetical protein ANCCEY_12738 [Ancylostoma ceylanicum]